VKVNPEVRAPNILIFGKFSTSLEVIDAFDQVA
jgi:hypothetical protein